MIDRGFTCRFALSGVQSGILTSGVELASDRAVLAIVGVPVPQRESLVDGSMCHVAVTAGEMSRLC